MALSQDLPIDATYTLLLQPSEILVHIGIMVHAPLAGLAAVGVIQ